VQAPDAIPTLLQLSRCISKVTGAFILPQAPSLARLYLTPSSFSTGG
jgi:hypothetical protein